MSAKVSDIIIEDGNFWVRRVPTGKLAGTFEVYEAGVTHSVRRAIIGFRGEEGLRRAMAEIKRRQSA